MYFYVRSYLCIATSKAIDHELNNHYKRQGRLFTRLHLVRTFTRLCTVRCSISLSPLILIKKLNIFSTCFLKYIDHFMSSSITEVVFVYKEVEVHLSYL